MNFDVVAAEVLKISVEEAKKQCTPIEEMGALYYWNGARGGLHVIIAENGEKLAAGSAVSFEKLLEAFKAGKRN